MNQDSAGTDQASPSTLTKLAPIPATTLARLLLHSQQGCKVVGSR